MAIGADALAPSNGVTTDETTAGNISDESENVDTGDRISKAIADKLSMDSEDDDLKGSINETNDSELLLEAIEPPPPTTYKIVTAKTKTNLIRAGFTQEHFSEAKLR